MKSYLAIAALAIAAAAVSTPSQAQSFVQVKEWDVYVDLPTRFAYVKTPMITDQLSATQRRKLLKDIPVGRFCEPEKFAHVMRFLASPLTGFITGEIIDLNGGLLMD